MLGSLHSCWESAVEKIGAASEVTKSMNRDMSIMADGGIVKVVRNDV